MEYNRTTEDRRVKYDAKEAGERTHTVVTRENEGGKKINLVAKTSYGNSCQHFMVVDQLEQISEISGRLLYGAFQSTSTAEAKQNLAHITLNLQRYRFCIMLTIAEWIDLQLDSRKGWYFSQGSC